MLTPRFPRPGRHRWPLAAVLLALAAPELPAARTFSVREVDSPAGPGATTPFLVADADGILMSWLEERDAGHALRFARWDGGWSTPRTVIEGEPFFVNWADFPSLLPLGGESLVAHWLARSGEEPYAYDVRIARSGDGGRTWSRPVSPHHDGTPTEHGFVSLLPGEDGAFVAIWLDGRAHHGQDSTRETAVRAARFDGKSFADETVLDPRVCDCCQTAAVSTPDGLLVAYRDRSTEEIRDIALVRRSGDTWTKPAPLHEDGWKIAACPVNGPALAALGDEVAAVWFTAADGPPGRVLAAFSRDGGRTFGEPLRIDDGEALGRVDVVRLDAWRALVTWMERSGEEGQAALRFRVAWREGRLEPPVDVARISAARAAGFPRIATWNGTTLVAWTDPDAGAIRLRRIAP
ncbi:MAG: sialidase family protein, partial [Acidobacteriota bacterium]